jgi:ABC-2 type transport system permease protein
MSSAELLAPSPAIAVPQRQIRYRGTLGRQVRNELGLIFRRRRNIAMLVVLGAVPILIGTAVKMSTPRPGQGPAFIGQLAGNGLFLAFAALTICLPVFLPLAIAVVAGDSIAGEAGSGTLRYLLTVPVSRTRLLLVKAIGTMIFIASAILLVAVVGIIVGGLLFGLHNVTLLSGSTVSLGDGLLRTLGVAAYVFVDLLGLAAIAMFFSTLTEAPIGAIAASVALVIAFAVLDSVPQLGSFRSVLLVHHWLDFGDLLRTPLQFRTLVHGVYLPLGYAAIFGAAAWARITTADVTA